MSRMLAAKAALATRVDALGEDGSFDLGAEHKAKLEARLRILEEGNLRRISGTGKAKAKFEKYHGASEVKQYPVAADSTLPTNKRRHSQIEEKKPLIEEIEVATEPVAEVPQKKKKVKDSIEGQDEATPVKVEGSQKKKKVKDSIEGQEEATPVKVEGSQKKKKVRDSVGGQDEATPVKVEEEAPTSSKKQKKKKVRDSIGGQDEATPVHVEEEAPTSSKKQKKKKEKEA